MARQALLNKWKGATEAQLETVLDLKLGDATIYRCGRLLITSVRLHDVGLVGAKEPVPALPDTVVDAEASFLAAEMQHLGLPTTFGRKAYASSLRREPKRTQGANSRSQRGTDRRHRRSSTACSEAGGEVGPSGGKATGAETPWVQGYDEKWGCYFYYNNETQESKWEEPANGYVPWTEAEPASAYVEQTTATADGPEPSTSAASRSEIGAAITGVPGLAKAAATSSDPDGSSSASTGAASRAVAHGAGTPEQRRPRMLTEEDLLREMGFWGAGGAPSSAKDGGASASAAEDTTGSVAPIGGAGGGGLLGLLHRHPGPGQPQSQSAVAACGTQPPVPAGALSEEQLLARMAASSQAPAQQHALEQQPHEQGPAKAPARMPPPPPAPMPPPPSPPPPLPVPLPPSHAQQQQVATLGSGSQPQAATGREDADQARQGNGADAGIGGGASGIKSGTPPPAPRMLTEEDILRRMALVGAAGAEQALPGGGRADAAVPTPSQPSPQPQPAAVADAPQGPLPERNAQPAPRPPPGFGGPVADLAAARLEGRPAPSILQAHGPHSSQQQHPQAHSPHGAPPPWGPGPHHHPHGPHGPHHHNHHGHPYQHDPAFPGHHPWIPPPHPGGPHPPMPHPAHGLPPPPGADPGAHPPPPPPGFPPPALAPHHQHPLSNSFVPQPHGPPHHHMPGGPHGMPSHGPPPPGFAHLSAPPLPPPPPHMGDWPPYGPPPASGPTGPPGFPPRPPPPPGFGAGPGPSPHGPPGPGFHAIQHPHYPSDPGHLHPQYQPYGPRPPYGPGPLPPYPGHPQPSGAHAGYMPPHAPPLPPPQLHHAASAPVLGGPFGQPRPAGTPARVGPHPHSVPTDAAQDARDAVAAEQKRRAVTWTLEELERQLEIMVDSIVPSAAPAAEGAEPAVALATVAAVTDGAEGTVRKEGRVKQGPAESGSEFGSGAVGGRRDQARPARGQGHKAPPAGRGTKGRTEVAASSTEDGDDAAFYDSFAAAGRGGTARPEQREQRGEDGMPAVGQDDGTRRVALDPHTAAYVRTLLPRNAAKYWMQRYSLFSKFDRDIQLDTEGWWSVTPEVLACHQAQRCRQLCAAPAMAVDACCGCGGNVIAMAAAFPAVLGVEISERRVEMARHNADVYGVLPKCHFLCADFFRVAPGLKVDVLFMSPPWGGPKYQHVHTFDVFYPLVGFNTSLLRLLDTTLECVRGQDGVVAAFLPRNTDLSQLASAVPEHAVWEVERSYVNNKLKGITLYAHAGRTAGEPNVRLEAEAEHGRAAGAQLQQRGSGGADGGGRGEEGAQSAERSGQGAALAAVTAALAAL